MSIWFLLFFFNDTATTEIYTLSLHDALPISAFRVARPPGRPDPAERCPGGRLERRTSYRARHPAPEAGPHSEDVGTTPWRSEEHTSELQSQSNLVCRLLLEKKKKTEHTKMHL